MAVGMRERHVWVSLSVGFIFLITLVSFHRFAFFPLKFSCVKRWEAGNGGKRSRRICGEQFVTLALMYTQRQVFPISWFLLGVDKT